MKTNKKSPGVPEKRRSDSFEKIIGEYVSRKPNTRQKNEIFEQSHSAKNEKGGFIDMNSTAKDQKNRTGTLWRHRKNFKKSPWKPKKEEVSYCRKQWKEGTLFLWNGFSFHALDAFKMKY